MGLAAGITIAACAAVLALAVLVALGSGRSVVGWPLVLLCLDVFIWNFADLACRQTGDMGWHWLDIGSSPLTPPFALHVVLAFTGTRRRLRPALLAAYLYFGALAWVSALGCLAPWAARFSAGSGWPAVFLAGVGPTMGLALWVLIRHLRVTSDPDERRRTGLLFWAFALVTALGSTELWSDLWPAVPRLGGLATLLGVALLALVCLRFQLLDRDLPSSAAAAAVLLAVSAFGAYLTAFRYLASSVAQLTLALLLVTLALFAALRGAFRALAARRDQIERLAVLGGLSAQLAHDLKNPLAALKGAAQFLREEWRQGRTEQTQGELVDLLLSQVERLQKVIDDYQRLGKVEPLRMPLRLNAVVERVLALQRFAAGPVTLRLELDPELPETRADGELLAVALENLVRNAVEAMPGGGLLTVRTGPEWAPEGLLLTVQDTGAGMNPRLRERALHGLFTTKAQGSGLGLAFARRVAEAHGGRLSLTSAEGQGTIVQLHLPSD
ncbi:MAG: two-component system sensor histidine kinase NtrB [Myxococcales bacterium]